MLSTLARVGVALQKVRGGGLGTQNKRNTRIKQDQSKIDPLNWLSVHEGLPGAARVPAGRSRYIQ